MNSLEQRIQDRIAQLKIERDNLVSEANRQVAAYTAAIKELEALLKPVGAEPAEGAPAEK
jgi:hypothetical protein